MSDARLRELERAWKESGSRDAEARLLGERLRLGLTSSDKLRLACLLGHEAAAEHVSGEVPLMPQSLESIDAYERVFRFGGRTALPRVVIAVLRREAQGGVLQALKSLEARVTNPDDPTAEARCRWHLGSDNELEREVVKVALREPPVLFRRARMILAHISPLDPDALLARIQGEVLPWALGEGDCVAGRAEPAASAPEEAGEAAVLVARGRAGELSYERLRLAALLGHPPALEATNREAPESEESLSSWVAALPQHGALGKEAAFRLAAATINACLARQGQPPPPVVLAFEQWVVCPCDGCEARVVEAAESHDSEFAVLGRVVLARRPRAIRRLAQRTVRDAVQALGESEMRQEARFELIEWLLRSHDLLLERVEARQRER